MLISLKGIKDNHNLSGAKLLIYAYLSEIEEWDKPLRCFSEDIGISMNTLKKYLSELEEEKLIVKKESGNNRIPSVYRLRKAKLTKKGQDK